MLPTLLKKLGSNRKKKSPRGISKHIAIVKNKNTENPKKQKGGVFPSYVRLSGS